MLNLTEQLKKSVWKNILADELTKPYLNNLSTVIHEAYRTKIVYPQSELLFYALDSCPFDNVKVVIIGQDPYHGNGQAHGLCFSVPDGVRIPPSLQNIYKEIKNDLGIIMPTSGNLERWAEQGVLLLNSTLTVEAGNPGSHQKLGWETFTDAVIKIISDQKENMVFILWGNYARTKTTLIDTDKHLVLEAPHPSPLSAHRGFFGCRHFSQTNAYLKSNGMEIISW